MVHCDVENMSEMDCLKVKTQQGSPPLGDSHLSRHYWPFSLLFSPDFLAVPGAVTQIGSHVQISREE